MRMSLDPSAWRPRPRGPSAGVELLLRADELLRMRHLDSNACEEALRLLQLARNYVLDRPDALRRADLLALCNAELGEHGLALVWLSEAIEDAKKLKRWDHMHRLLGRRAASHHYLLHSRAACDDLEQIFDEQRKDGVFPVEPDIIFELDCRLRLAIVRFFLREFRMVKFQLDRAQTLLTQIPSRHAEEATVRSLWANLFFWQDQPKHALSWALPAAATYMHERQYDSAGRTHILIAEALLAVAADLPAGTARDANIREADHYITLAAEIAARTHDDTLADLAFLVRAQLKLAAGHPGIAARDVGHILDRTDDPLMLVRAWTTLGDCHVNVGEMERAITAYRAAMIVVEHTELPAHAERARQALWKYSESTLD